MRARMHTIVHQVQTRTVCAPNANVALHAGRCFSGGVNGGGFDSENWILTEVPRSKSRMAWCCLTQPQDSPLDGAAPEAIIYVAVVDAVGVWVYRIPAAGAYAQSLVPIRAVAVLFTLLPPQALTRCGRA